MFRTLFEKSKFIAFTLRFSILSIFVTFFIIAMVTLIAFTYYKFSDSMTAISFHLMKESSSTAFEEVADELRHIELKCISSARQLESNIINSNDLTTLFQYTTNLMVNESMIFPSLHSVFWGDRNGSFVMSEKESDGSVSSEIIDNSTTPAARILFTRDKQGHVFKKTSFTYLDDDPRIHPWYQAALKSKQPTWLGVYQYRITKNLGISVSTPVYDKNKELKGVINYNIRLDYLRRLIENIDLTENSVIFIITTSGEVLAFPYLEQYRNTVLTKIDSLPNAPWVVESFARYKASGKQQFIFNYAGSTYLATYKLMSHFGPSDWLIGAVVPMNDFVGSLRKTQIITALVSLIILVSGIAFASALISAVVRPLKKITNEIEKIKHFDLKDSPPIQSRIKEVSYIAEALHSMKKGLRSFQKYVPATLVRQLIESGEDVRVGGIKKPIAILFSDIQNFTSISEQTTPELLTRHVCDYFDELTNIILACRGTIDKYIGDAIMAFWGAPLPEEHSEQQAALAAIQCVKRLKALNAQWASEGKPVLATRIGIHAGDAIVGNLGSTERLSYTAIGDSINVAGRLEGINKLYGTQIIISGTVYHAIKHQFVTRMLDCVRLKGKAEPYYIYELITDDPSEMTYDIDAYTQAFAQAFSAYQAQGWDEAIHYFHACMKIYPEDKVAQLFINRCETCKTKLSYEQWNGVWTITEK